MVTRVALRSDIRLTQTRPTMHAGEVLGRLAPGPHAASLYIHIPFCTHKCHYCDFYSLVDTRDRQDAFVDRLCAELAVLSAWAGPLRTIFVGGGTPSLLRVDLWSKLLACLHDRFDLSGISRMTGEFTVECNPETVSSPLMDVLSAGGVTRVSLGAQSFNPAHLKTLERWHDPEKVLPALAMAEQAGITRRTIDLIFAIPGQTLDEWDADLRTALGMGVEHMSCYALTYEPGTAMTARLHRGDFSRTDEDLEAEMFLHTLRTLRGAGLDRYEVSNFAIPGAESLHNLAYWRQESWLAAGPAASGHVAGMRWKNQPRLDDYLKPTQHAFSPVIDVELPDERRALLERLMTGLRLREGVDGAEILTRAAGVESGAADRIARTASNAMERGHMHRGDRWSLTDDGFLIADAIILDFATALDAPH